MTWTIIVATGDTDQLSQLVVCAKKIKALMRPADRGSIYRARSLEEVEELHQRIATPEKELIIVEADLPSARPRPHGGAQSGLALLKEIQREEIPPASILVTNHGEHLLDVQRMKRSQMLLVDSGTEYISLSVALARSLGVVSAQSARLSSTPVTETTSNSAPSGALSERYALIEVDVLEDVEHSMVRLHINDPLRPQDDRPIASLYLDENEVAEFLKESRRFRNNFSTHKNWHSRYASLGERVREMLWKTKFRDYYLLAEGAAESNIRLRFNLEPAVFDGLWESITTGDGDDFMMLRNSVTRRARRYDNFQMSFEGEKGNLSILGVESKVSVNSEPVGPQDDTWNTYWNRSGGPLERLDHVETEMRMLEGLRSKGRRSGKGENARRSSGVNVKILRAVADTDSWSLADTLEEELKKNPRRYDVLHFAGHAIFASDARGDQRGYLIFSGSPKPRAVPIAKVAGWLAGSSVQLVYLSCCRSSAAKAAIEIASNKVPMTIGFEWNLEDEKAVEFAEAFYKSLLASDFRVCHSVRRARSELKQHYDSADSIWASPVLVAQPSNWMQVEGVLRPPARTRPRDARQPLKPIG
ncbi:CHAT domain-containing protein [Mesorhizobium sp. MSK_1335]|uniref:CHAT domain-containing protein n=1 Tax=Mesorhizobium montanum TaxID=3072323 RepID=A0ABU4ZRS2_9HYPH|nr:CHAT domain-containing protein [Mesorhizobium sp. MSK_1335]MDX8527004.1 CHAT domain-containing protein [Mesorhizobium sp. MSK_1335]